MAVSSHSSPSNSLVMAAILRGLGSSLTIGLCISVLLGIIYYIIPFSESTLNVLFLIVNAISVLAGGTTAARLSKTHGYLNGGIVGVAYFLVLWVIQTVGIVQSEPMVISAGLIALLAGLIAGGLGGMLGIAFND